MTHLFTSESVSEGHPDKVCDRISDEVVDLLIGKDKESRVACETFATTNRTIIGGEIRCSQKVEKKKSSPLPEKRLRISAMNRMVITGRKWQWNPICMNNPAILRRVLMPAK